MSLYDPLASAGYTDAYVVWENMPWERAVKFTRRGDNVVTDKTYHAKKGGKYYRVTAYWTYRNRTHREDLLSSRVAVDAEITQQEYDGKLPPAAR